MNASPARGWSLGVVLILIGGAAFWLAGDIGHRLGDNHDPGPQALPKGLGVFLILGGTWELIRAWMGHRAARRAAIPGEEPVPAASEPASWRGWFRSESNRDILFLIVMLALYLPAIPWVGFTISTLVFATALMLRLRAGPLLAAGMSLLMVAAIYMLFVKLFQVQLPEPFLGRFGL